MTSIFISMTLDGVTLFSRIKNEIHVKACITVKIVGGIFYVMAENWKNLKVRTAFFIVFFVCVRIEIDQL